MAASERLKSTKKKFQKIASFKYKIKQYDKCENINTAVVGRLENDTSLGLLLPQSFYNVDEFQVKSLFARTMNLIPKTIFSQNFTPATKRTI